ncbi:cytochrome d ubiquinol oxidase subunit II [Thiobacillus sedimenti]|uniref:Cytochrome d ubiquinol oxidase subunit II n=1 Tax=Thiobacillus sedimenti TaxID=3110231 RepID=A0ABZ1CP79_9PROT|nr:cytochrome d ubiquinol oxidase subunit II [Thiobacillus sp. SCUT-2]WRS40661.1 cytochrome d ubiquinol oxidase subunit II [Thiobacillus sp. SCUT-2]
MDYETLKLIWWLLIGVLLVGFAVMDGHDMGMGVLLPFVGRNDLERRALINTVAPHWDGNQVWFITAGGAIFAAWPLVYATAFSGFYWAMMAALWALFFRPVGFDYRSKIQNAAWRSTWDWGLFIGGAVPPIIFGVAFGNLLQGVPFHFNDYLMSTYTGSFWALLNPFALLAGVVSLAMITTQGANYLMMRTEGNLYRRVRGASQVFAALTIVTFALAGVWVAKGIDGYVITSAVDPNALPDPLAKTVEIATGAWMRNYAQHGWAMWVPVVAFAALAASLAFARLNKAGAAFWSSSLACAGIIGTAGVSMFPFVMPSSSDPRSSLTVYDAVSSHLTLGLMLGATVIFMPLIIFYTAWAYKVMWGKVTTEYIAANDKSVY